MAPPRRSARPDPRALLVPGAALVLAVLGGLLLWSGWRASDDDLRSAGSEGLVGVPVAALDLPAYTEIQLEHLLDPASGELAAVFLPEESLLDSTIVDPRELVGRVLARAKSAARVFREEDFLPVGTRPGLVAGIPPGKRALRIDAGRVSGIVGLNQGDRFDLVATYRGGAGAAAGARVESVYGVAGGPSGSNAARSRLVAANAAVVTALATRALPGASPSRSGAVVQEMVIALEPDEVSLVTEALELATRIDCIPRSGLPSSPSAAGDDLARDDAVGRRARSAWDEPLVDVIEGDRRSLRLVPEAERAGSPAVAAGPPAGSRAGSSGGSSGGGD